MHDWVCIFVRMCVRGERAMEREKEKLEECTYMAKST